MRRIAIVLGIIAVLLIAPFSVQADEVWVDPFTCDPYHFTFDFPLISNSPYDSIMFPMLVRAVSSETQQITISMWPDYTAESSIADSSWFSFAPDTAPLPPNGVAAFNITCKPPYQTLEPKEYVTYIRVARTINGEQYWDRPLGVKVRIGSAVPLVDYSVEGWKTASIKGDEQTAYTQDQMVLSVFNKAYTVNEFCLYPVDAADPSSYTPDPDSVGDFRYFQAAWRQSDAISVKAEPVTGSFNSKTKHYDEYKLTTDNFDFGSFLAASYDRTKDKVAKGIYPFKIQPARGTDVPFVLRVLSDVPSGTYRLQIHVEPSGISVEGREGAGVGIEYESKIVLVIERAGQDTVANKSSSIAPWIIIGAVAGGLVVLGFSVVSRRYNRKLASEGVTSNR